jgi:hypothetical protein
VNYDESEPSEILVLILTEFMTFWSNIVKSLPLDDSIAEYTDRVNTGKEIMTKLVQSLADASANLLYEPGTRSATAWERIPRALSKAREELAMTFPRTVDLALG